MTLSDIRSTIFPRARSVLAVSIAFGALAWAGELFTADEGGVAAVWFANALVVAILLRGTGPGGLAYLPPVLCANLIANLLAGDGLARSIELSLLNGLEILLAWGGMLWIRRPRPDMLHLPDLLAFVGIAAVAAPLLSGALASLVLRIHAVGDALDNWLHWSITDGLGMLIVVPAVLILADAWTKRRLVSRTRMIEALCIVLASTGTTFYIFWQQRFPLLFLDAPIVMLYAFRLGAAGAAIAILNLAFVASIATALGHGPIHLVRGDLHDKLLILQVFLASSFAMGLPVAAILEGKRRVEAALAHVRAEERSLLENMREVIFRVDDRWHWEFLNPAWETKTGRAVAESLGVHCAGFLHPEERDAALEVQRKLASGENDSLLVRLRFVRSDGECRHGEFSVRAMRDADGGFAGAIGNIRDVSDAVRAEQARLESDARFRRLGDAAPLAIYQADAQGLVTYVNPAWSRMTGLPAEAAMGDGWKVSLTPESLAVAGKAHERLAAPGETRRLRIEIVRPDGTLVVANSESATEYDAEGKPCGFVGVISDITAEVEAMTAMAESRRTFELLASLSPAGIVRTDAEGAVLYCNEAWLALAGISLEAATGGGWAQALHKDDRQRVWDEWQEAVACKAGYRTEFRFVRSDGSLAWVDVNAAPEMDEENNLVGFVAVVVDVTENKTLVEQLVSAKRHAEQAASAKSNFLANMSHEIRTPMNGVLGFADLLLETELDEAQRKHAQLIVESGKTMMRLLNDILDISKVEAGQMTIATETIDLRHILQSCVSLMTPTAQQKGLLLKCVVDEAIPDGMSGDALRLRQIVLNLVGNALKFTPKGYVFVRADLGPEIRGGQTVRIAIEDTGVGIAQGRQDAIFKPFEQEDDSTVRRFGGTGLGLTISRQLAILMGGNLELQSKLGEGSVFTLSLPLQQSPDAGDAFCDEGAQPLPAAEEVLQAGEGGNILLAEDHDVNQLLVTTMLERLGYTVQLAVDGVQAIAEVDRALAEGRSFDLVLMDIQMPYVDGYQAARMIRSRGLSAEDLPIVALTANAYADDIAACHDAGMQAHIAKPIDRQALAAAIDKWIKRTAPSAMVFPAAAGPTDFEKLEEIYRKRRDEALALVETMVNAGNISEPQVRDAIDTLHKLAGTAGMFGEAELGKQAGLLERQLAVWTPQQRAAEFPSSAAALLRSA